MATREHVVVLTGAGVSADSGVPTFRGSEGLWEGARPEEVATPEAWRRDPARVWRFYQARRAKLAGVQPNAAHTALADFERRLMAADLGFTLITQNVDDLHDRAGSTVWHMHGELARLRCEACDASVVDREHVEPATFVPCAACGAPRLRPDVVWFGELPHHLDAIERALATCTRFLALGTSGQVWPAAGLLHAARAQGARTTVASLEPPDNLDVADTFVQGRAAEVVPPLLERLRAELGA
jgi:NAD-dependent deacetylase